MEKTTKSIPVCTHSKRHRYHCCLFLDRRNQNDETDDEYLELRARAASKTTNTGKYIPS